MAMCMWVPFTSEQIRKVVCLLPKVFGLLIALLLTVLFSCQNREADQVLAFAEQHVEQSPDSVLTLLTSTNENKFKTPREKAMYGLFLTMASHKCSQWLPDDTLIDRSIEYFSTHREKRWLAYSLYYKGAVNYFLRHMEVAVNYLKLAEEQAESIHNDTLCSRIYDCLCYLNYRIGNDSLSFMYARKAIPKAMAIKDMEAASRLMHMQALAYSAVGKVDSLPAYIMQSLELAEGDTAATASLIGLVAGCWNGMENDSMTERYAMMSLKMDDNENANAVMGHLRYRQGKYEEAKYFWDKALKSKDPRWKAKLLADIAQKCADAGHYDDAYVLYLDSLQEMLSHVDQQDQMKASLLQAGYSKEKENRRQRVLFHLIVFSLLLICSVLMLLYYSHLLSKSRKDKAIRLLSQKVRLQQDKITNQETSILEYISNADQQSEEIKTIQATLATTRHDLEKSIGQNIRLKKDMAEILWKGLLVYQAVSKKKGISRIQPEEMEAFVAYISVAFHERWQEWSEKYHDLTPRRLVFLVMSEIHQFSTKDIARVLGITESGVRMLRKRIREEA